MRMSDVEMKRFLDEPRIAKVATNGHDGYPHLIATWYLYEKGWLYFFCGRATQRAADVKRDNRVALIIDDDHYPYKQVTFYGLAQVDESLTDEYVRKLCARYLGPFWGSKYEAFMNERIDPVIVKVKVSKMVSWDYYTGGYLTKVPGKKG